MRQCLSGFMLWLLAACIALPAQASDEYAPATPTTIMQVLIRFGALNPADDRVIDEYGKFKECELYQAFHDNDFKWEKIRSGLRKEIEKNLARFPTGFFVRGRLYLDRYDFDRKMYKLGIDTGIQNVNILNLARVEFNDCGDPASRFVPRAFQAALDRPVTVEGLYIPEEEAKALLARMTEAGNLTREIWVRFNMHVTFVEQLNMDDKMLQKNLSRMDARLENIEFYEDKDMTKLIYTFEP